MFEMLKFAYNLGKEKCVIAENLFWVRPYSGIEGQRQYANERAGWKERNREIDERAKRFNWIENLVYNIGDDNNMSNIPFSVPRPLEPVTVEPQ